MRYTRQWLDEKLQQLYPNRVFTEHQKDLLLKLLLEEERITFADSDRTQIHSKMLLECKQEIPDEPNILAKLIASKRN